MYSVPRRDLKASAHNIHFQQRRKNSIKKTKMCWQISSVMFGAQNLNYSPKVLKLTPGIHFEDKKYREGKIPRKDLRSEKLYIYYDKNFMGWNGPRKMRVFQPKFNPKRASYLDVKPTIKEETIELLSSKYNKIVSKNPKIIKKIGMYLFNTSQSGSEKTYFEIGFKTQ